MPEKISQLLQEYLDKVPREHNSSPSTVRRETEPIIRMNSTGGQPSREEGVIARFGSAKQDYGFIKPDSNSHPGGIFFHRRSLVNKALVLKVNDRVQFRVSKTKKGLEAIDIFVQNKHSHGSLRWDHLVDNGIQEGFITATTETGGYITSSKVTGQNKNLLFSLKDIENHSGSPLAEGTKVHFKVKKRGGKCIAFNIDLIGALKPDSDVSLDEQDDDMNEMDEYE